MVVSSRVRMFLWASALLGLIVLLATLQYRWLGQISESERSRMRTNLAARAGSFAQEFDREVTRAYLTFQFDPLHDGEPLPVRLAQRYERWHGTSRYPRLIKDVYVVPREGPPDTIQRFHPDTRFVEPVPWPDSLQPIRERLQAKPAPPPDGAPAIRTLPPTMWKDVPALLVPIPVILFNQLNAASERPQEMTLAAAMNYTILVLDRDYISTEMLPALTEQHFRSGSEGTDYQMAVVDAESAATIYSNPRELTLSRGDASVELLQVRPQDFGAMVSEVRRFSTFVARPSESGKTSGTERQRPPASGPESNRMRMTLPPDAASAHGVPPSGAVSIIVQQGLGAAERRAIETGFAAAAARPAPGSAPWRLVVRHPAGSLETAVANARRRNLLVSSGILAVLGVSIGFLIVSTRRAQELARQQMEFVAAVSHELRTPLAVIRSAADNLAEGVVREDAQVRRYGELVRGEGRRLSEMVEQILELAGIHSGQRGLPLRPVAVTPLLHDIVRSSEPLLNDAGLEVEYDLQDGIPPVLGDEQALRRAFQNLVGNAIKYGASGRWLGLRTRANGREVQVTIADKGIGIQPAEQEHIFEPFYRAPGVIAAQIQGAGLGLSLVERIVEAHGGRIFVRSAPGIGSEFTVHLPAASEEPAGRTVSASDAAASQSVQAG